MRTFVTRKQKNENNESRRFQRSDTKMSAKIRRIAAEIMAANPSVGLGEAMTQAIRTVANSG